jgi:hypothetical protein
MSKKREIKHKDLNQSRKTKNNEDPELFNSKHPVWKFSEIDFDHKWGWNYLGSVIKLRIDAEIEEELLKYGDEVVLDSILRMSDKYYTYDKLIAHLNRNTKQSATIDIVCSILKKVDRDYLKSKIIDKLIQFEGETWEEIKRQQFGKNGKSKHHYQDFESLHPEARDRLIELQKDDSPIFSFRLEGSMRVWGILDRGIFSILWFDPYHEIYETEGRDNNSRIIK